MAAYVATGPDTPSPGSPAAAGESQNAFAQRPEVYVGAAFAGGLLVATVLRVLGK
ncbi:MAG: hypothetical protein H0U32_04670 [Thermoleophilaceae bacterium]|nr:hypothetical protein [Thermoleophilaceae bacterium]